MKRGGEVKEEETERKRRKRRRRTRRRKRLILKIPLSFYHTTKRILEKERKKMNRLRAT